MTAVPSFATLIRPIVTLALLCGALSLSCNRSKPAAQPTLDAPPNSEATASTEIDTSARLPDEATLATTDGEGSPDQYAFPDGNPGTLDVRTQETAHDLPPAAPLDPLENLPTATETLSADHELETLYQCVESNLIQVHDAEWRRRINVQLAMVIARHDPPRGLATLANATESRPFPEESAALALAIGSHDLRRAAAMAVNFVPAENRRRALEELVGVAAKGDVQWAIVISDLMRQRIPREIFLLRLIEHLSETRPEDSTVLTERIIEPLLNDWAVALVAAAEAPQHLDRSLSRIESIESPVVRDWALLRLSLGLAASAPDQVDELIPQVQRSLVRDELLVQLALAVVDSSPERSLPIALRIEDPELRRRGLDAVARSLLPHKPALARFMVERKREPPLAPSVWLPWLEAACRDYPEAAPAILEKALDKLTPEEILTGLLYCCRGAPGAVRSAASIQDVRDDRLTRCYVCAGIMPDGLVAARTVRNPRVRDETLLCALQGLTDQEATTFKEEMTNLADPLLRDLAAVSLAAKLRQSDRLENALAVAGAIVDPFLRAPALAQLAGTADKAVAGPAKEAFVTALRGLKDSWRQDAAREALVRALWNIDEATAWHNLAAINDLALLSQLLDELMVHRVPAERIRDLTGAGAPGAPAALACLRSIVLEPPPAEALPEKTPDE